MIAFHARRRPSDAKLNSAERRLLAAVVSHHGHLRAGGTGLDNPSGGAGWGRGRTVRAGLLAGLVTGDRNLEGSRPRAVRLRGPVSQAPLTSKPLTCLPADSAGLLSGRTAQPQRSQRSGDPPSWRLCQR